MSREIRKKLSKQYFDLITSGQKTFEFRVADFECEPGDTLVLEEYEYENDDDTLARRPTGREMRRKVGYVGKTKDFAWLKRPDVKADAERYGYQTISLLDEPAKKPSHELFQVSGKVLLFNNDKSKMVLLHYDEGSKYSIPGGHVEDGETVDEAIRRELREELGIDHDGKLQLVSITKYRSPSQSNGTIDLNYVGELDENAPISIKNNSDGIVGYEWAPVDKVLRGEYEDWIAQVIEGARK